VGRLFSGMKSGLAALTFCAAIQLSVVSALAQTDSDAIPPDAAIRAALLADQLADYGHSHRDPLVLMSAARAAQYANLSSADPNDPLLPSRLSAAAIDIAADKELRDIMLTAAPPETRGVLETGNATSDASGKLPVKSCKPFPEDFQGGERAIVVAKIVGNGDAGMLDLTVTGAQTKETRTRTDNSVIAAWTPPATASYTITLCNHSSTLAAGYRLLVNHHQP
jgi:hypothetical protein